MALAEVPEPLVDEDLLVAVVEAFGFSDGAVLEAFDGAFLAGAFFSLAFFSGAFVSDFSAPLSALELPLVELPLPPGAFCLKKSHHALSTLFGSRW